jgi:uncharacterized protein (TIGR00645 family)
MPAQSTDQAPTVIIECPHMAEPHRLLFKVPKSYMCMGLRAGTADDQPPATKNAMDKSPLSSEPHGLAERLVEQTIFASRWLLEPFYLGLTVCLVVLLIKFGQKMVKFVTYSLFSSGNDVIPVVLSLIDLSLIANLLLIVMFSGYENFVSRFELDDQKYKPAWMGHVDFGDLKLKLLTSIIAISAIHLLESFNEYRTDKRSRARLEHWNSTRPRPYRSPAGGHEPHFRARAALIPHLSRYYKAPIPEHYVIFARE